MRIIEFDGSEVKFEVLEPKWSVEEVDQRHHDRIQAIRDREGQDVDLWDFNDEVDRSLAILAADHRERLGMRRNDGRQLERRWAKESIDKVADRFMIPTNSPGWEKAALEALRDAPAHGKIKGESAPARTPSP